MSTAHKGATHGSGLTFGRIVRAEWIKFATLRSTWIVYAVALLIALGLGSFVTYAHANEFNNHHDNEVWDPVIFTQTGVFFGQLAIGVLGVLSVTGEYTTGMIRASMSAVPRRTPVLFAKVVVFAAVTATIAAVMSFGAYFIGQALVSQFNLNGHITDPGAIRGLLGATYYLTVVGLIGVGLGFAIRNTGGAIATLIALILVLPLIVNALPRSWNEHITEYLPLAIAERLFTTTVQTDPLALPMWENFGLLALYAAIAIGLGWLVVKRRDV